MTLKPIDTTPGGAPTAHSSSGLVQPMFHTASATSDANGNITFTFDGVFTGQILIGSFSCPSAPYNAQFTAYNNSQEVYSWQSSNNPGPLRVSENQQITVSGTGLVPSTQYVMNWVGYSTVGGFAPQIVPASHTDVVLSTNQGGISGQSYVVLNSTQVTVLSAPPVGFAYRLHSILLQGFQSSGYAGASADGSIVALEVGGGNSYLTLVNFLTGQTAAYYQNMNGMLIRGEIQFYMTNGSFYGARIDIRYDLIQI